MELFAAVHGNGEGLVHTSLSQIAWSRYLRVMLCRCLSGQEISFSFSYSTLKLHLPQAWGLWESMGCA